MTPPSPTFLAADHSLRDRNSLPQISTVQPFPGFAAASSAAPCLCLSLTDSVPSVLYISWFLKTLSSLAATAFFLLYGYKLYVNLFTFSLQLTFNITLVLGEQRSG